MDDTVDRLECILAHELHRSRVRSSLHHGWRVEVPRSRHTLCRGTTDLRSHCTHRARVSLCTDTCTVPSAAAPVARAVHQPPARTVSAGGSARAVRDVPAADELASESMGGGGSTARGARASHSSSSHPQPSLEAPERRVSRVLAIGVAIAIAGAIGVSVGEQSQST